MDETVADDVEDWDSLSHIILISTIERKYNIKFNMKEIVNLQNVGELVNLILEKINL
ncbi:MAG: acyl carrier protein [bacterium]|nr:acyl carrier protein [bacterium]